MHGDDDGAEESGSEEHGDDLKRQYVTAHEGVADVVHGNSGDCGLIRQRWGSLQYSPRKHGEDSGGDGETCEPAFREDAFFRDFRTLRQQDCEDNQDGDCANIDEDLREAGKLRIEGKEYVMRDGDVVEFRFNV